MNQKKDKRGGYRPNAGRKNSEPTTAITLRVPNIILLEIKKKYTSKQRNKKIVDFLRKIHKDE